MRNDRDRIFSAVRAAVKPLQEAGKAAAYPQYDVSVMTAKPRLAGDSEWAVFARNLTKVNGRAFTGVDELVEFLKGQNAKEGYIDPSLPSAIVDGLRHHFKLHLRFHRSEMDLHDFGITLASGLIVESGTLILEDGLTSNRLGALAPWVHVAVATAATPVYQTLADAIAHLGDDPNVIWVTGPSKTADVEGILIEGVHGPGQQVCLRLA